MSKTKQVPESVLVTIPLENYENLESNASKLETIKKEVSSAFFANIDGNNSDYCIEINCKKLFNILIPFVMENSPTTKYFFSQVKYPNIVLTNIDDFDIKV